MRDYDQVIKAQAASVIDSLDKKNNAGVVVIGTRNPTGTVATLSYVVTLADKKKEIIDKISMIDQSKVGGQSDIDLGINKANQMLRSVSWGKNIILISDGRGLTPFAKTEKKQAARQAADRGIKIYVAGVGATDEQDYTFLSDIATIGDGTYFPVDASN